MLAICVWSAVKQALSQILPHDDLRLPATGEEILRQLSRAMTLRESATLPAHGGTAPQTVQSPVDPGL
jgi:hypothetical protein